MECGIIYQKLRNFRKARVAFTASSELEPNNAQMWNHLGERGGTAYLMQLISRGIAILNPYPTYCNSDVMHSQP